MRRVKVDPDLEHVAYHEAGHAVIGLALGIHTHRVTIVSNDYSGGRALIPNHPLWIRDELKRGNCTGLWRSVRRNNAKPKLLQDPCKLGPSQPSRPPPTTSPSLKLSLLFRSC